jgi:hypothetical protein
MLRIHEVLEINNSNKIMGLRTNTTSFLVENLTALLSLLPRRDTQFGFSLDSGEVSSVALAVLENDFLERDSGDWCPELIVLSCK